MSMTTLLAASDWETFIQLYEMDGTAGLVIIGLFIIVIYLLMPTIKAWAKQNQEKTHDLDQWVKGRADKLEQQRDEDLDRLREENRVMRATIADMDKKISQVMRQSARLDQKLRSFEWMFLIEVCDALVEKVAKQKLVIAKAIEGKVDAELSDAIDAEFNKLIADLKATYVVRQLEKQASMFKQEDQDEEEQRSITVQRESYEDDQRDK